jgi:site-specific recombinase XerD
MSKIPGIFERPPDSGVYWISYTDTDGNRRREKAGKLSAALDLQGQRRAQVRKNEYIAPRQKRVWNFQRLAAETIKNKALRLAPLTIETDTFRLKKLLPLLGGTRFDRITSERVEETLATLRRSGLSTSTCNRYRSFISSCFSYAMKINRTAANPVARVSRFKENDPRVRWLRPEEEARIRKAFVADAHEWEFDLALYTGMRSGEQFGLKWKDCDLERGILTVKGKTGRRHVIANEDAVAALRKLHKLTGEKEFVSPEANDGLMKRAGRRWLTVAAAEANVKDFKWHDLRHTFASRLAMSGVDIRTIQELLGHKSIVMTMKYAHLSSDHRQKAVAKIKQEPPA